MANKLQLGIQKLFGIDQKDVDISNAFPIEEDSRDGSAKTKNEKVNSFEYRLPEIFGISLKDWRNSVETAWSEINPTRTDLADIYTAMTSYDSQVIATVNQRKLFTMQGDIKMFNTDGTENKEATRVIKSPSGSTEKWFRDFISYSLDSIFWGYEMIMIDTQNGKVKTKKIPERNVIPNHQAIMRDTVMGNTEGNLIHVEGAKYDTAICKVSYTGNLDDLGLLAGCAPYFFSKVTGNWKQHADRFGMLTRVLKTDSENKDKMVNGYHSLKNAVRGNFMVIGKDEELTFEGDGRTSIAIYQELNNYCDQAIAKIILGQTGTTDEKSFSGSAGVHKEILDAIVKSDREFIESIVNEQLVPKLQRLGILPLNVYFGIAENVNVDLTDQAAIVKTLSDAGFRPTTDYITETFGIELDLTTKIIEQ